MEQFEGEFEALHQEIPQPPLLCPRCGSLDTKFRYFNNNNYAQPRYYCKTCNRMWTEGGNLRPIPFGGRSKNKTTKNSSSTCGNSYQPPQLQVLSMEQLQISQHLTPSATMVPQNYDATMIHQSITNMPDSIPQLSSYNVNDEISDFETIQSLLKPEEMNQPLYVGSEFDLSYLQDVQAMPSQQALPQHFMEPLDTHPINNQVNNVGPYHLPNYNMVQPSSLMNYMPSDSIDNFSLWNNFSGGSSDTETSTTFIDTNQWPSFPSYGPP